VIESLAAAVVDGRIAESRVHEARARLAALATRHARPI
jgi:hypothetical protein